jgi:hypothetical protein
MPTLGEFIARARNYGYRKRSIRIPELGVRIVYLRRGSPTSPKLVELPAMRESDRLARLVLEDLCERSGVLLEDFGL